MQPERTVVVAGDLMVDWNIALRRGQGEAERLLSTAGEVAISRKPGGAALLGSMIAEINDGTWTVLRAQIPDADVDPAVRTFHHTWTLMSSYPPGVWRAKEFLGLERADQAPPQKREEADASLVVIDDSAMGFRDSPDSWPLSISSDDRRPRIILKSCSPFMSAAPWKRLLDMHAGRLIFITTVDDLRRIEVQVSRQLSWERAAQDLVWEVHRNQEISFLRRCANAIVSFGPAGAVVFSGEEARLVFDPRAMERELEKTGEGSTIGNTTILAAAAACEVMTHGREADLTRAVRRGVAAMRAFYQEGYGSDRDRPDFPFARIAGAVREPMPELVTVAIKSPEERMAAPWTILDDQVKEDLKVVAERIAVHGPDEALRDVPQLRIGKLFTVDRREIESLRGIKRLLAEYDRRRPSKPLSIAVFGPPGSGKSFGVEQVAKSAASDIEVRTFNLSQFAGPEDLHGALHQVRDISLSGKLPIVFWDEFDTRLNDEPLGWLRYFLAPMQDGSFQEGQITHPIGTSVFVFAGGTAPDMKRFGEDLGEAGRKSAKVPDFISRLKGFLNVAGPNRLSPEGDRFFMLRRAILLRSLLERNCAELFDRKVLQIDAGVLRAFLQTTVYKHGARSMEAIIAMSALAGKTRFERSSLPSETELRLHVHGRDFIALVHQMQFTDELVERLAAVAHDIFREGKKRDGWAQGAVKDEEKKTHPLLVEYAKLPDDAKEANRVTVRTIPRKLAVIGYVMTPARSGGPEAVLSPEDVEKLAELEHELWMAAKRAAGFTLGPSTEPKQNEHLVPWSKLPDDIRQIDRDLVTGIVPILARAGYTIVRVAED